MEFPTPRKPFFYWAFLSLIVFANVSNGFYLPGTYMHTYSNGEPIFAKVNSLTSIETELPFSYYSLPYCKPSSGVKKSAENLGELLMGDQIDNSPYRFRMNVNETVYLCTTSPLNEHEVKLLKQRTRDLYQVNMILDNLPVMRYTTQNGVKIQWTGFPVGYTPADAGADYIINHLKFMVLVHEYEGRGVEIIGTGEEGLGVISEADKKKAWDEDAVGEQEEDGHLLEVETVKLEAELDSTEVSSRERESELSLDDILSADSEGSKLHLDGFSDEVGQQRKEAWAMY